MKKIAIVTGASSGIGYEFVKQISRRLHSIEEIWVIARRQERMERLKDKVDTPLKVLPFDITDSEFIENFRQYLEIEKPDIKLLINAAGFGKIGVFDTLPLKEQTDMIDLNCKALTEITYACLPYISNKGRIIQMASAAAFIPQPTFAVYAATKSYVLSFTRGLNRELRQRQITATAVCPGPVETEFFYIAEQTGQTSDIKNLFKVYPEQIVHQALLDTARRKEVSIYGLPMKTIHVISKMLPHCLILDIMDKIL